MRILSEQNYKISNKNIDNFNKLNLKEGQKITGKVISVGPNNEAVIKVSDGRELKVEIKGTDLKKLFSNMGNELVTLEYTGEVDGKLHFKMAGNNNFIPKDISTYLEGFTLKGVSNTEAKIYEGMMKNGIPLTKDNISLAGAIMYIKNNIGSNEEKINSFVQKYLESRNLNENSIAGNINDKIVECFTSINDSKLEDLLFIMSNDLDINQENIKSFEMLFNGENSIEDIISKLENELNADSNCILDKKDESNHINNNATEIENEIDGYEQKEVAEKINNEHKNIDMESDKSEVSLKSELTNSDTKEIVNSLKLEQDKNNITELVSDNKTVEDFINNNEITKNNRDSLKSEITKIMNDSGILDIKDGVLINDNKITENDIDNLKNEITKVINESALSPTKEEIDNIIKDLFKKLSDKGSIDTNDIDDILSNTFGEKIIETKESLEKVSSELLKEENNLKSLKGEKTELVLDNTKLENKEFKGKLGTELREVVKEKEVKMAEKIKDIISKISENEDKESIKDIIKNNISNLKVFNKISDEYYYLDLPVKFAENKYNCKLVVKDERKKNTEVNSKNIKVAVSVQTVSLGKVDSLIKISNNFLDVKIKCKKENVDIIESSKELLVEKLNDIGFISKVQVEVEEEEKNVLVSYREFFDDSKYYNINLRA